MARKYYGAKFKAQIALEAIKNNATTTELSNKHGVHPTQIQVWKSTLEKQAVTVFTQQNNSTEDGDKRVAELERKIGQLTIENDFLKKLHGVPKEERLSMIDKQHKKLSLRRQCILLDVCRSNVYYKPTIDENESWLANTIHDLWLEMPFYGYRSITAELQRQGLNINRKKVLRIMREMRLQALYPKPKTTVHNPSHKIYPYLLRDLKITHPNQVWATDITYIKTPNGFMNLIAIIDVYSRFVLSWRLSNTLDTQFCEDALKEALACGKPEIMNTDQGCQFTSMAWINLVEGNEIKVSMDGRGRWADNVFIERFWRTLKYEHVFIHSFESVLELKASIGSFIKIYNYKRLHQSLGYNTPDEVYQSKKRLRRPSGGFSLLLLWV
jgi:putative transposase